MKFIIPFLVIILGYIGSVEALTKAEKIYLKNIDKKITAKSYKKALNILQRRIQYEKKKKSPSIDFNFELLGKVLVIAIKQNQKKVVEEALVGYLEQYSGSNDENKEIGLDVLLSVSNSINLDQGRDIFSTIIASNKADFPLKNYAYNQLVVSYDIKSAERLKKYGEWFRFLRESKPEGSFEEAASRLRLAGDFDKLGSGGQSIEQKEAAIRMVESQINSNSKLRIRDFNVILKALISEKQTTLGNKLFNYFKDSQGGGSEIESVDLKIATRMSNFVLLYKSKKYDEAQSELPKLLEVLPQNKNFQEIIDVYFDGIATLYSSEKLIHLKAFVEAFNKLFENEDVRSKIEDTKLHGEELAKLVTKAQDSRSMSNMVIVAELLSQAQKFGMIDKADSKKMQILASGMTQAGLVERAQLFYKLCREKAKLEKDLSHEYKCLRQEGGLLLMNLLRDDFNKIKSRFEDYQQTKDEDSDEERLKLVYMLIRSSAMVQNKNDMKKRLSQIKDNFPNLSKKPFFELYNLITEVQIFLIEEKYPLVLKILDQQQGKLESLFGKNSSVLYLLDQLKLEAALSSGSIDAANRFFTETRRRLSLNKPFIGFQRVSVLMKGMVLAYAIRSLSLAAELLEEFKSICEQGTYSAKFKSAMNMWYEQIKLDQKGLKTSEEFNQLMSEFKKQFADAPYIVAEHERYLNVLVKGTK